MPAAKAVQDGRVLIKMKATLLLLSAICLLAAGQRSFDLTSVSNVECTPGEAIILTIPSNPTTGRMWQLEPGSHPLFDMLNGANGEYTPSASGIVGASGTQKFQLQCHSDAPVQTISRFVLTRSTADGTSVEQFLVLLGIRSN